MVCSEKSCTRAFHVTCAMTGRLCLDMCEPRPYVREYRAYCDQHAGNAAPTNKRKGTALTLDALPCMCLTYRQQRTARQQ